MRKPSFYPIPLPHFKALADATRSPVSRLNWLKNLHARFFQSQPNAPTELKPFKMFLVLKPQTQPIRKKQSCLITYDPASKLYFIQRMKPNGVMENLEPQGFNSREEAEQVLHAYP